MIRLVCRGLLMILTVACAAHAQSQLLEGVRDQQVTYTPTTSTESLLERYSQFRSSPNDYWQLTKDEWSRYESLVKNSPWAQWRNNASPLAILAHYTQDPEEKRRYARIEAELDTWRQYSVTEFQTLYDKERSIVHARYEEWFNKRRPSLASIKPHDKLRLFVQAGDCDAHCRALINRVIKSQAKLDIYVLGAKNDEAIFAWAESAGVPVERVKTKEITLNHDSGVFQLVTGQLGLPAPKLPSLFRQIAGSDQVVAI